MSTLPAAKFGDRTAVVVFSGGQDSTTCLYWALHHFAAVEALSFDYGQRHEVELACAKKIAQLAGVKQSVLTVETFKQLGGNSLVDGGEIVTADDGLPNSFVPGRNIIFFTYAAAYAYQRGIGDIVTGVSQTDYSGYPDCRNTTMRSLTRTLNYGMEADFTIHTPLSGKTKAQTVRMAKRLGCLEALAYSHTCYHGQRPGCKSCPACELRAKGFEEAGIPDPLFE